MKQSAATHFVQTTGSEVFASGADRFMDLSLKSDHHPAMSSSSTSSGPIPNPLSRSSHCNMLTLCYYAGLALSVSNGSSGLQTQTFHGPYTDFATHGLALPSRHVSKKRGTLSLISPSGIALGGELCSSALGASDGLPTLQLKTCIDTAIRHSGLAHVS